MKYLILIFIFSMSLKSNAQLPVTDVLNTYQNIKQEINQLRDLIEQYEQLKALYEKIKIAKKTYESLTNAQALQYLSREIIDYRYGKTAFSKVPFLNADNSNWENVVGGILEELYDMRMEYEFEPIITDVYSYDIDEDKRADLDRLNKRMEKSKDNMRYVSYQQDEVEKRKARLEQIMRQVGNSEDQSSQKILQLISMQMGMLMQQQEALIQNNFVLILNSESNEQKLIAKKQKKILALKKRKSKAREMQPELSGLSNIPEL